MASFAQRSDNTRAIVVDVCSQTGHYPDFRVLSGLAVNHPQSAIGLSKFYFNMSLPKMNATNNTVPRRMFIPIANQKRGTPSDRLIVENFSGTSPVDMPLIANQITSRPSGKQRNLSKPDTLAPLDPDYPLPIIVPMTPLAGRRLQFPNSVLHQIWVIDGSAVTQAQLNGAFRTEG